jgi:hypothetical protein
MAATESFAISLRSDFLAKLRLPAVLTFSVSDPGKDPAQIPWWLNSQSHCHFETSPEDLQLRT